MHMTAVALMYLVCVSLSFFLFYPSRLRGSDAMIEVVVNMQFLKTRPWHITALCIALRVTAR